MRTKTQNATNRISARTVSGLMMALLCLLSLTPARASTIPVTSTADSGAGSLREALANAADGDTIDATGISGTILLTSDELLVTNSVTIVGPGPANLAVDGDANYRVFSIEIAGSVSIFNLTVTNGFNRGTKAGGGGINNYRSTLTVSNCVVTGNSSVSVAGGIYNDGFSSSATLTVIASIISGNSADFGGGGIYSAGAFVGNATATIDASTLSGNSATNGGGIFNDGRFTGSATLTVSNCTFIGNSADFVGGGGGGIYNGGSKFGSATLIVANSAFTGNSAGGSGGGGILSDGSETGSVVVTVINSTISSNTAGSIGGGISSDATDRGDATLTVRTSTISANSAFSGGGIYSAGDFSGDATLEIIASTISGNSANFGTGGGIDNGARVSGRATLKMSVCTLSGNFADNVGGGLYNHATGNGGRALAQISACTFDGNSTDNVGGGIFNGGTSVADATVQIGNTILKRGGSGANISNELATVTSFGFNLCSDNGGGFLTATGDQTMKDPKLGPLADNGGPTRTHLPLADSPAIDQGLSNTIGPLTSDTDQRGFARTFDFIAITNAPFGDGTDIGAVEVQQTEGPNHAPVAKCKNVTVTAGAGGTANASINDGSFDPDGDFITVTQDPPGPYPIGTTSVTLKVTDSHGAMETCTADVTVIGVADLAISKAVVSGQAKPGQTLIYTMTVKNLGPNPASEVVVNDAVPQGTTFYTASPAPYSAPPVGAGGTVVWHVGSLGSGSSVTLTLNVKVSVKGNNLVVNTASVSGSSYDPNAANNSATITSKRNTK